MDPSTSSAPPALRWVWGNPISQLTKHGWTLPLLPPMCQKQTPNEQGLCLQLRPEVGCQRALLFPGGAGAERRSGRNWKMKGVVASRANQKMISNFLQYIQGIVTLQSWRETLYSSKLDYVVLDPLFLQQHTLEVCDPIKDRDQCCDRVGALNLRFTEQMSPSWCLVGQPLNS